MSQVSFLKPLLCASCVPACGLQGEHHGHEQLRRRRLGGVKYLV